MMFEVRRIHDVAQVRVSYRQSDMEDEAVKSILQQCPNENADGHQPDQIVEPALRFTPRGEIQQEKAQKRVNPKGTKTNQPVSRRHTDSHSSEGARIITEICLLFNGVEKDPSNPFTTIEF